MTNLELDCKSAECNPSLRTESWGVSVSFTEVTEMVNSIAASNGHRFGLFLFEALQIRSVISKYSIDILVSNMSLGLLLFRWSISIVAFQESVKAGVTEPTVLGIGCLSSSRCFSCLPLMLLPRLKTTFAAFFTVGCQFEGEQKAMAEAWFVIYPAIGEFLLFYFSLLSLVAKLSSRRMSDVLFGPTMVFFYLMHNLRFSLAQTGWFEFDGRIATVVSSEAFEKMALLDFFTTDAALRMNGNTKSLFLTKIIVLGLNLISFFWAKRSIPHSTTILEVEKSVAIQACNVGGLGRPFSYHQNYAISRRSRKVSVWPFATTTQQDDQRHVLSCYELVRIGYIILGDKYLVPMNDWFWFMVMSPLRSHQPFSNLRVCAYSISLEEDGTCSVYEKPHFCSISGPELVKICWSDISLHPCR
jgi:hypothetical protein